MTENLKSWPYPVGGPPWRRQAGARKHHGRFPPGRRARLSHVRVRCQAVADGVLFLMHDATLERTTNGHGTGGDLSMGEIAQLDAGSWHSRAYAGEALPTLEALARWCLANHFS